MIFRPYAWARDKLGSMDFIYESDISGIRAGASKGIVPEPPPIVTRTVIVPAAFNGGRPFASDRCTDEHVPSMLTAKNYIAEQFGDFGGNALVLVSSQSNAQVTVYPDKRVYVVDLSGESGASALAFDVSRVSGPFEIDVWISPSSGGLVYPETVSWFDGYQINGNMVSDGERYYLFRFTVLAACGLFYGRYLGSVDKEV